MCFGCCYLYASADHRRAGLPAFPSLTREAKLERCKDDRGPVVDAQIWVAPLVESRLALGELVQVQVQGYCTTAATRVFLISSTPVPAVSVPAVSRTRGCWARALQVQVLMSGRQAAVSMMSRMQSADVMNADAARRAICFSNKMLWWATKAVYAEAGGEVANACARELDITAQAGRIEVAYNCICADSSRRNNSSTSCPACNTDAFACTICRVAHVSLTAFVLILRS